MNKIVVTLLLAIVTPACAGRASAQENVEPATYLSQESANILKEGDRIQSEANRMRLLAAQLAQARVKLLAEVEDLNRQWNAAVRADPEKYVDYPGRDRSQKIMISDSEKMEKDVVQLKGEGRRLNGEAVRLWKLSTQVDPDALSDMIKRVRGQNAETIINMLRQKIIRLAQADGVQYRPN